MKFDKYFGFVFGSLSEGGDVRTNAFREFFQKHTSTEIMVYQNTSLIHRLIRGIKFLIYLLLVKNKKLFIHYIFLRHVFTDRLLGNVVFVNLIGWIIEYSSKKNSIFIEVNDLPYEQALDLDLPHNKLNIFDIKLYSITDINFIFASFSMRDYVVDKYKLNMENTDVVINGGINLQNSLPIAKDVINNPGCLRFVYAGSLHKGRQIEDMINIFKQTKHKLFLLGSDGEWLKEYVVENITYLGSMKEKDAHLFVSQCDMGVIPYDDSKFYYNLCCPTKASFYISAGIPFIATQTVELMKCFNSSIATFMPVSQWLQWINSSSINKEITSMINNVWIIKKDYEWDKLINDWFIRNSV